MAADVAGEDFVTIVPVGENIPTANDPSFVTVLTVGDAAGAAEVIVRRPRGARLGLGLKFEGGSAAAEKVKRLMVQSCAPDSPAANASTPWGKLIPGDEILAIDNIPVSDLTRIDCVRRLKDSDETLILLVQHFKTNAEEDNSNNVDCTDSVSLKKTMQDILRPSLPPPVPPRKLGKKNSFKEKSILQTVGEQNGIINNLMYKQDLNGKESIINGQQTPLTKLSRKSSFDSHLLRQNKDSISCLKKGSPEEVRRLVRRLSDGKTMPPEAEVYIDLLSTEWERCLAMADAESDDTGSSISTVVDRLGSMTSSVENSIPSTPVMQPKTIDIQKVLNCIENIDSNILNDLSSRNLIEKQSETKIDIKSEKIQQGIGFAGYEHFQKSTNIEQPKANNTTNKQGLQQSDKNNNNTTFTQNCGNTNGIKEIPEIPESKSKILTEVPKPMPRNTKIERPVSEKRIKPASLMEIPIESASDMLLTPTKKNCIETWLQHSEAEMSSKIDDNNMPEVLPRLIDFVQKPTFKECSPETPPLPLTRPTTAPPPPPPPETREDGSGASLDTIGELDESLETTNEKLKLSENKTTERKPIIERNFWEDRVIKSDAEDKSSSNDETPLPTCPRQPPDGVETPSDAIEKVPEPPSRPPPRINSGWSVGTVRSRYSYTSRSQDPRSEASVKDKIAMFSNDRPATSDIMEKCGTLPSRTPSTARKNIYSNGYSDISSLDKRLTKSQENLDELPRSYLRIDRPEVVGALKNSSNSKNSFANKNVPNETIRKPIFYGSTSTLPIIVDAPLAQTVYHSRSASDDNNAKNVHKSNLEYLIEQRKKSMSKLRGLVIPEAQGPIIDLPEIKVKDPLSKVFLAKPRNNNINNVKETKVNSIKSTRLSEDKWNTNLLPNNIPKYSPAFKRKSLQVYTPSCLSKESTPERKFQDKVDALSKMSYQISPKPSRMSLDNKNRKDFSRSSDLLSQFPLTSNKLSNSILNEVRDFKNVEIKICTATEIVDSDNDSAMSSTQSSFRSSASSPLHQLDSIESDGSRLSPRIHHYTSYNLIKTEIPSKSSITEKSCGEYIKRNVCRSISSDTNVSLSSSAGSAATSGSQASCSSLESSTGDSDKMKVSKSYNIDTINRRNILASAKCRSGRDVKLKSPVVETKMTQELQNKSPCITIKASERLSSLTSSVSALSNKGDTRRRNKVIAETDSDSDCEVSVRQRKTDFKNTRLKRNSSSSNKSKPNENHFEITKTEDPPTVISEKIITEIKKTGLDIFKSNQVSILPESNEIDLKRNLNIINNKKEEIIEQNHVMTKDTTVTVELKPVSTERHLRHHNDICFSEPQVNEPYNSNQNPSKLIKFKRGGGAGVGLILAGGIDCEAKDVTVHRVLGDSVAAKAGLRRGAKIRSINGCSMFGLTHAQSVAILKDQRSEIVIEIEDENEKVADERNHGSEKAEPKVQNNMAEHKFSDLDKATDVVVTVSLEKAGGGAGLGFGLDGGRDSPYGDKPLTIKKLFAGGAAAQCGRIVVGAELLSAGGVSMKGFTRTQAWAALKALPAGTVTLVLKTPK